ncbi:hypothetical protein K502DRAFT_344349 [Neoconidiobolus thromboides FSU 785]|nr:hypothetical protein K502DRAFT_344349 [Neoconidiobolus thromboides FSU 785]
MDKDREEAWKKSDEEFKARSTQIDNDNNRRFEQELNRAKDNFPSIFDNIPSKSDNPKPTPIANPEPKKEEPKKEEPKKEEPKKEESKKETSIMNIGNSFKCDFDCSSIQNRCKFDCFPNDCNDQCTKAYQECKSKC